MTLSAHAYVIKGTQKTVTNVLLLLQKEGTQTENNPDLYVRNYTSFVIDDARTLIERAQLRSVSKHGRVFVIVAPTIPADAQNVLLKIFEEPPRGVRFFLIVSSPELLLPTLRSRMQILEIESQRAASIVDVREFLKSGPEDRIEMIKPLLEKGEDEKRDLSGTIAFLSELESVLSRTTGDRLVGLKAVYRARKYITDRGALAKTLLEQTALLIPKVL
jgi:DNA polymerase III delta prime subunit